MRDVTPGSESIFHDIFLYLKVFLRHPIHEVRHIPDWNWSRVLTMQVLLAIISGILSAFLTTRFSTWKLAQGIFFFPIIATLIGIALASFFYYYFQIFEKRTVAFNRLCTLVFISMTVFYLFHAISSFFGFFDILGIAFSGLLLIVGLADNFQLEKKRSLRLVGILFLLIFVIWAFEKMRDANLVSSVDSGSSLSN